MISRESRVGGEMGKNLEVENSLTETRLWSSDSQVFGFEWGTLYRRKTIFGVSPLADKWIGIVHWKINGLGIVHWQRNILLFRCAHDLQASVSRYMENISNQFIWGPIFRRHLSEREERQFSSLLAYVSCVYISEEGDDRRIWSRTKDCFFSVSSFFFDFIFSSVELLGIPQCMAFGN